MSPYDFIRLYGWHEAFNLLCAGTTYVRNGKIKVNRINGQVFEVSYNGLSDLLKSYRIINSFGGVMAAREEVQSLRRRKLDFRAAEIEAHINQVEKCNEQAA